LNEANGRFWLVWNPEGRSPTCKHPSRESAQTEAGRLAKTFPGQRFWVLEAQGFMRIVNPCAWTPAEDGLPF
jgi:hypothetical protein